MHLDISREKAVKKESIVDIELNVGHALFYITSSLAYATQSTHVYMAAKMITQLQHLKEHRDKQVAEIGMHTLAGSNMITLINHKHKYVTLEMTISMDGVAVRFYSLMFSTVVYCLDDFRGDRFVKCMENGRL